MSASAPSVRPHHALYPGSFNPLHNGHLDVIVRAARLFDELTVAVLDNPLKAHGLLSLETRVKVIETCVEDAWLSNVNVITFSGLLAQVAREVGAHVLVKSLRNTTDFNYEAQMAHLNRELNQGLETMFLLASPQVQHVSSSRMKELFELGADISEMVPPASLRAMRQTVSTPPKDEPLALNDDPATPLQRPLPDKSSE